ncbi:MAG: tetratricopeptide repeat protein [Gracilimonas sp.]
MYDFKLILKFIGVFVFVLIQGCAPGETISDNANTQNNRSSLNDLRNIDQSQTKSDQIVLNYANESSGIQIKLDPDSDQFYLDLKGMKPAKKDTVFIADSTLIKQRTNDIQEVLAKFRQAQDLFYLDEYTEALRLLNETLEIAETADAYALKGTIHFMMGNRNATRQNWNRAVQLNPDLPIPSIPELEEIIEDIINDEQINEEPEEGEGEQEQEEGDQ